jgi:hypothetical protein
MKPAASPESLSLLTSTPTNQKSEDEDDHEEEKEARNRASSFSLAPITNKVRVLCQRLFTI